MLVFLVARQRAIYRDNKNSDVIAKKRIFRPAEGACPATRKLEEEISLNDDKNYFFKKTKMRKVGESPVWAPTKATVDDKFNSLEDAEGEDLIDFAKVSKINLWIRRKISRCTN
ncbi:uncharacterized protein CCR75_007858 [Bremia lactucae]|uniref:Uncharacterized protein n=1 Tax=Bremia lactucae TaxID=4779 RepID=A0A976IIN0_BRELC|nr:hypothetical protein CCR75_007858 [Bremia lactucae]